ncbi:MAG: DnaJ domain-containing protein [Theionarchaea archaeon]|nr:DnaJ domain-containing protein [Theionarchaea archaeon]
MNPGAFTLSSILFFYIFFAVLVLFLTYGLWQTYQEHLKSEPNPLSAVYMGIPDSINLFDTVNATLRVKNCGKSNLKKIHVLCGNTWTFPLKSGDYLDIPIKLDTVFSGKHQVRARILCRQWELQVFCWYHVFQRIVSEREKYLKILGLKLGASQKEIKKARNKLAKMYHPDTGDGHEEKMKEINEAYNKLMAS